MILVFLSYIFGQARLWIALDHTWGDDGVLDVKLRGQKWALVTQFDSVKRLTKYKAIAGPSFKKFKDPGICFGSCKEYLPERGTWVRTHIYMMVILDRFLGLFIFLLLLGAFQSFGAAKDIVTDHCHRFLQTNSRVPSLSFLSVHGQVVLDYLDQHLDPTFCTPHC